MSELAIVLALARSADRDAIPALRPFVNAEDPRIRLLVQLGLARAGDPDPDPVDERLVVEPELANYVIVAARAGALAIRQLDYLAAQAAYDASPVALRANCIWSLAQHDRDRALELLDDTTRDHVVAIVKRRGGVLVETHGQLATIAVDRVTALLGSRTAI